MNKNIAKSGKLESLPVDSLIFDPSNPRLPKELNGRNDEAVLEYLMSNEGLDDLMRSIASQGFFSGEPLLVTGCKNDPSKYVVIEGNRRLAALKLLTGTDSPRKKATVANILEIAKGKTFDPVPCIVFPEREDILGYLGYRHITGIKEWDHLAKARYLKQLFDNLIQEDEFKDAEPSIIYKALAGEIGSKPHVVATLLRGLSVIEFADEKNVLQKLDRKPSELGFSLLTTALNSPVIRDYLYSVEAEEGGKESDYHVDKLTPERVQDLLYWLYGSGSQSSLIGESRNIRKLIKVIENPISREYFQTNIKSQNILDVSFMLAGGLLEGFENLLVDLAGNLDSIDKIFIDIEDDLTEIHYNSIERLKKRILGIERLIKAHLDSKNDEEEE